MRVKAPSEFIFPKCFMNEMSHELNMKHLTERGSFGCHSGSNQHLVLSLRPIRNQLLVRLLVVARW